MLALFPSDVPRLAEAFAFAADLHSDQQRKGTGKPYLSHLLGVTSLVIAHGGDEDQAIAALLHDGPEDRGGHETLDRIRNRFGERVADMVHDCSDTFETPKPPWLQRKELYIAHANEEASTDALLVSIADKVHNLGCIEQDRRLTGDEVWERFSAPPERVLWYYESLYEVFQRRLADSQPRLIEEMSHLLAQVRPAVR